MLGGKYELLDQLGAGSMGVVYRAKHQTLKKYVAVKVLHPDSNQTAKAVARFEAEARAASRFEHANSVSVLDFGREESDGLLYIVMEHIDGRDLRQVVMSEGPLDERRACRLMAQVMAALAAAHDQGIVHRDMKPGNIMVTKRISDGGAEEEFIKICDFGIAKLLPRNDETHDNEPLTLKGAFFGTPAYMSPEQARGDASDARTDIYACGLILWMLLAGQRPFHGDNAMSVAMQQIHDPLPSLDDFRNDVSRGVMKLIRKATEKKCDARFKSAREMYQVLQAYASEKDGEQKAAAMVEQLLSYDGLRTEAEDGVLVGKKVMPPIVIATLSLVLGLVFATVVISSREDKESTLTPLVSPKVPSVVVSNDFVGPPIPEKVYLTIEGVAEGTEVYSMGQLMGVAPGQIAMIKDSAPVILVFKNEEYVTTSTKIVLEHDRMIRLSMKQKLRAPAPIKIKPPVKRRTIPRRDRLENPFE